MEEEYPHAQSRAVSTRATGIVTRGWLYAVVVAIIMDKLGVWILDKIQWGKLLDLTWHKIKAEAIEFLGRPRMKTTQISPPSSPRPIEGGGKDDDKETKSLPVTVTQYPQSKKGS